MSLKEIEFAVFCIENIAEYLNMNAKDVYHLLGVKSKLLLEYIVPCYEPLHTQSKEYIVREVVDMMRVKGLISEEEELGRLKYHKPNSQILTVDIVDSIVDFSLGM